VKVVKSLSGGAHLVFPSESSLAVRVYYPDDLQKIHDNPVTSVHEKENVPKMGRSSNSGHGADDDFDGLLNFFTSFRYTLVLLVMDRENDSNQLHDVDSYFHRAQRLIRRVQDEEYESSQSVAAAAGAWTAQKKIQRVHMVNKTETGIHTIMSITDAIKRVAPKNAFLEKCSRQKLVPDANGDIVPNETAAASIVCKAIRNMAYRFEIPPEEVGVLMSLVTSVGDLASMSKSELQELPLTDETKQILSSFFCHR